MSGIAYPNHIYRLTSNTRYVMYYYGVNQMMQDLAKNVQEASMG